jgi:pimeloyl-ACP methyl ester carboxylesterase
MMAPLNTMRNLLLPFLLLLFLATPLSAAELESLVQHGFADSHGVKIHYASLGTGPLIVMIHGFPDFWYTWRDQMEGLSTRYQVVAIDQRGCNLSDKPEGPENYDMRLLVGDVAAVIRHLGKDKAIIVGHDWGGAVAWQFAINVPQMTDKLIILNLPHMRGLTRELAKPDSQQARNSAYARRFQQDGAEKALAAEGLAGWVKDPEARKKYVEAFQRSSFTSMVNYYKRNYPREPYREDTSPVIKVQAPVLEIHGLKDTYLLAGAMDGTWNWVEKDFTLVTIPDAGHFVQQDASAQVTNIMRSWLQIH